MRPNGSSRALVWLAGLAGALLPWLPSLHGAGEPVAPGLATQVYQRLLGLREGRQAPPLVRDPALDRIALERAREIAAAPPGHRLPPGRPLSALIGRDGPQEARHRRLSELIEVQQGVADPVDRAVRAWRGHDPSLELIVDPRSGAAGVGAARAADATLVLVVVFAQRGIEPGDLTDLERRAEREVNRLRAEAGLRPLRPLEPLREVARGHSEDMARRGYFAHESPEGRTPGDRVRAGGVGYEVVAENIGRSEDMDDPVAAVVDGWLHSPGHYQNLTGPQFTHTAVGVALDGQGAVFFTQLFVRLSGRR